MPTFAALRLSLRSSSRKRQRLRSADPVTDTVARSKKESAIFLSLPRPNARSTLSSKSMSQPRSTLRGRSRNSAGPSAPLASTPARNIASTLAMSFRALQATESAYAAPGQIGPVTGIPTPSATTTLYWCAALQQIQPSRRPTGCCDRR